MSQLKKKMPRATTKSWHSQIITMKKNLLSIAVRVGESGIGKNSLPDRGHSAHKGPEAGSVGLEYSHPVDGAQNRKRWRERFWEKRAELMSNAHFGVGEGG